jgi:hypothetical protein
MNTKQAPGRSTIGTKAIASVGGYMYVSGNPGSGYSGVERTIARAPS